MAAQDAAPHADPAGEAVSLDPTLAGIWLQVWEKLARLEERYKHQAERVDAFEKKLERFKQDFENRSDRLERWLRTTTITVAIAAITMAATVLVALLDR